QNYFDQPVFLNLKRFQLDQPVNLNHIPIILLPPGSPHPLYTPLFRSPYTRAPRAAASSGRSRTRIPAASPATKPSRSTSKGRDADRKSTRLNSSHVKTSYAVFCLKKKTLTEIDLN